MTNNIFQGIITALITPFKEGRIDFEALERLIEYQVKNKVDGIVIAGSTGEAPTLSKEEYHLLMKNSVEIAAKRIPIIAGCNSNYTSEAVNLAIKTEHLGIDGLMCTIPPYNKPTQDGLFAHFKAIHDATNLPIILYNAPNRTGTDFKDETLLKLADLPRIIALKDTGTDIERPLRLSAKLGKGFNMLTGDDPITLAYNAHGGKGCVSVASNILPKLCKEVQHYWNTGNTSAALRLQQKLFPFYNAEFAESNPIPVKYAASLIGLCENELRLPLTPANELTQQLIKDAIKDIAPELIK